MATYITSDNFNHIILIVSAYFLFSQIHLYIATSILFDKIKKLENKLELYVESRTSKQKKQTSV